MTRGFGASLLPQDMIKNLRKNVSELTPANIASTVHNQRAEWDRDYGTRRYPTKISVDKLFEPCEEEVTLGDDFKVVNENLNGMRMHFTAHRGFWSLMIYTMPDGKKEFSFNVSCGDMWTWHVGEAENHITSHHGAKAYQHWKRVVRADFEEQKVWLMKQAMKHCRGFRAWSVTCSDRSSKLLSEVPRIHVVNPGVAFMFL